MDEAIATLCMVVSMHGASLEGLVDKLENESYQTRKLYSKKLQEQLKAPWEEFLIKELCKERKTLECQRRVENLTKKWHSFLTDYEKFPWIDALPKDYPNRQAIISSYLERSWGQEDGSYTDWFRHRYATALWLRDLRDQGWWMSSLWKIQEQMIPNERYWIKNLSYP